MTRRLRWYKRDVDAWRGGTRGMSLELRGFYSELLDAMWDRQGPLENDVAKLSVTLCCNPRTVRKLLPQLVALGKISETAEGLTNARMQSEFSTPIQGEVEANSRAIAREFEPKVSKNPENSTRDLEVRRESKRKDDAEIASAWDFPPLPCDPKDLSEKLVTAANGCIANPGSFPGLMSMSIPLMWIERGADLDRDVIPTVEAIGKKQHGKGIRSWDYFTQPIAEAKAKREQGLPTVNVQAQPWQQAKSDKIETARKLREMLSATEVQ